MLSAYFFLSFFQSIAIGYKRLYPSSVVIVQAFDAKPSLRIKPSEQSTAPFRKYGFVDSIKELDPIGTLGLLDPDFQVCFSFFHFLCMIVLLF